MNVYDENMTFASGSEIVSRLPFKYGKFERCTLAQGDISAVCDDYKVVVFTSQFHGSLVLNSDKPLTDRWSLGEYCIFCPGNRISGRSEFNTSFEVLHLNSELVEKFIKDEIVAASGTILSGWARRKMPLLVQSIWQRLRSVMDEAHPAPSSVAELCVELLLVRLLEDQLSTGKAPANAVHMPTIRETIHYIDNNLGEPLDLKSLSAAAGLSEFYFSRVFRAACGTTVHRFVLERRLDLASQLLQQGQLSISRIALEAGFSSQSHLTTSFRHRYGVTPAAFRQLTGIVG
jgi:AraC-like DNA-binding protein